MDDWGAIEEVLLLDAVEQDGFGNWDDIAAHVVTKTARSECVDVYVVHCTNVPTNLFGPIDCREHYNDMYINSTIGEGKVLLAMTFSWLCFYIPSRVVVSLSYPS